MLGRLFIDHPKQVGESYGEHFAMAAGFGVSMVAGGLACLVHALVPGLCKSTGSGIVKALHRRMVDQRAPSHAREGATTQELEWVI